MMKSAEPEIPDGFRLITDIIELKEFINPRLKPKGGLYKDENLKSVSQQLYLFSPKDQKFYPKWYGTFAPDEKIIPLIKKGLIYGRPIQ